MAIKFHLLCDSTLKSNRPADTGTMAYALENENEFARLEEQSKTDLWSPERELSSFKPAPHGVILDAGCGSGIVTRYLASRFPEAHLIGCDQSVERIKMATEVSHGTKNIGFQVENLSKLSIHTNSLDGIVCRYVLEHLSEKNVKLSIAEMYRCLKPGGQVCLIDIDGYLSNIYPVTPLIAKFLSNLARRRPVDLNIGRKLPFYLAQLPFEKIDWTIQTLQLSGPALETELRLLRDRFAQSIPLATKMLGSKKKALKYNEEYFVTLQKTGTVLFYNKFIVTATKPSHLKTVE